MKIIAFLFVILVGSYSMPSLDFLGKLFQMPDVVIRENLNDYKDDPELARKLFKDVNAYGQNVLDTNNTDHQCKMFISYQEKLETSVCRYYFIMDLQEFSDITGACAEMHYLWIQIHQNKKLC